MSEKEEHQLAEEVPGEEYVWNFAYGSNLSYKTLVNRLKGFPGDPHAVESVPCVAKDWVLLFDVYAHPFAEPAFANIRYAKGKECHGVAHKITRTQYDNLAATEGGGGSKDCGYQPTTIHVEAYDGRIIETTAFVQRPPKHTKIDYWPSARYMNLLKDGAADYGLKEDYIAYLRSLPSFRQKFLGKIMTKIVGWFLMTPFMRWPHRFNNAFFQSKFINNWIWRIFFYFVAPGIRFLHWLTFGMSTTQPKYSMVEAQKYRKYHYHPRLENME